MHFLGLSKWIDFHAGLIMVCTVLNGSFLLNLNNEETPLKEKNKDYKGSQCDLNYVYYNVPIFFQT